MFVSALTIVAGVSFAGQNPAKTAKKWIQPKTPWGDPDIQGIWPGTEMIGTPLQRPASLGSRDVVSDEEFRQREAAREAQEEFDTAEFVTDAVRCDPQRGGLGNTPDTCANGVSIGPPLYWQDRGKPNRQASLVVDPPDGRIPPLTPEAQRLATARAAARRGRGATDSWEDRSAWERCLTRGAIGFLPTGYNNGNRIIQAPGYVIILVEMIHEARVVPLKGSAHAGPGVRSYNGDSRGHWEGNTLVVETTSFGDNATVNNTPLSSSARLVERFTRVDANTLNYEVTVDDPKTWTQAWKMRFPLTRDPGYELFEYACHEGNLFMSNALSGARADERAAEEADKKGAK
jgi:hypothetical protein